MILVPLLNPKFAAALAARRVRTSGSGHSVRCRSAGENYPVLIRGRATGLVAGSSKFGGLAANALTAVGLVPGLIAAASVLALPIAISAGLVARYGRETRNKPLE